jgi:peptidoglycan/LPS O-acetylase OafA/YrhL
VISNPPSRLGYQPPLDGLRGIAILMVVAYHAGVGRPTFPWLGSNGVSIFFTLSGFLITRLLIEEREARGSISFARFYGRRALRLLPAFGVVVVVTTLIGLATLGEALRASSYLANWWLSANQWLGPLSHTWSLSIEEQFYVMWPLLLVAPTLVGPRIIAPALLAITLGYRLLGPQVTGNLYAFATHLEIPLVLLGVCLALMWRPGMASPRWAMWLGFALVVAASVLGLGEPGERIANPLASFGAVFLIVGALAPARPQQLLAARPLVALGLWSYSLYLWHYPVMFALGVVEHGPDPFRSQFAFGAVATGPGGDLARSVLAIGVSLLLAVISYRLIERPLVGLRKRWRQAGLKDPGAS